MFDLDMIDTNVEPDVFGVLQISKTSYVVRVTSSCMTYECALRHVRCSYLLKVRDAPLRPCNSSWRSAHFPCAVVSFWLGLHIDVVVVIAGLLLHCILQYGVHVKRSCMTFERRLSLCMRGFFPCCNLHVSFS